MSADLAAAQRNGGFIYAEGGPRKPKRGDRVLVWDGTEHEIASVNRDGLVRLLNEDGSTHGPYYQTV